MSRTTLLYFASLLYGCILDVYAASVVRFVSQKRHVNITYRWLRIWKLPRRIEHWNWGSDYLELLDSRTVCFPAIELFIALCLTTVIEYHGLTMDSLALTILLTAIVINAAVDHELGIFPDKISLPLIGAGLFFGILAWPIEGSATTLDRILGGVLGFLSSYGLAMGYYLLKRREGLGGGDIKMWTAIGFFLGIKGFLFFVIAFSLIGTVAGVFLILISKIRRRYSRNMRIRTGAPYAVALACVLLFPLLPDWYLDHVSRPHVHSPLAIETINRSINDASFGAGVRDGQ